MTNPLLCRARRLQSELRELAVQFGPASRREEQIELIIDTILDILDPHAASMNPDTQNPGSVTAPESLEGPKFGRDDPNSTRVHSKNPKSTDGPPTASGVIFENRDPLLIWGRVVEAARAVVVRWNNKQSKGWPSLDEAIAQLKDRLKDTYGEPPDFWGQVVKAAFSVVHWSGSPSSSYFVNAVNNLESCLSEIDPMPQADQPCGLGIPTERIRSPTVETAATLSAAREVIRCWREDHSGSACLSAGILNLERRLAELDQLPPPKAPPSENSSDQSTELPPCKAPTLETVTDLLDKRRAPAPVPLQGGTLVDQEPDPPPAEGVVDESEPVTTEVNSDHPPPPAAKIETVDGVPALQGGSSKTLREKMIEACPDWTPPAEENPNGT